MQKRPPAVARLWADVANNVIGRYGILHDDESTDAAGVGSEIERGLSGRRKSSRSPAAARSDQAEHNHQQYFPSHEMRV
jgi:hypothetical protein